VSGLIGVVADFDPANATHRATEEALAHARGSLPFEWLATDAVGDGAVLSRFAGLVIGPASPYRSMDGALRAIRYARERGVPLVAT
jgi:CTP synthase (UTP-ammonia lyase)